MDIERSLVVPFVPNNLSSIEPFARIVKDRIAHRLWQGENILLGPFTSFAAALSGSRVRLGIGVGLLPMRHPVHAAVIARSLALSVGSPIIAGFGPGSVKFQEKMLGKAYESPLTATREYLSIVRNVLDGKSVDSTEARYYHCPPTVVPTLSSPEVSLGLGVLRPGMARLAGEVADVAITWLAPPDYIADVLVPAIRVGAKSAGRRTPKISAIVPAAVDNGDDPTQLLISGSRLHLHADNYRMMLKLAGVETSGELTEIATGLIDCGGFIFGNQTQISLQIERYKAAGVDEIVFNTTGRYNEHGSDLCFEDLSTLLANPLLAVTPNG